MPPGSKPATTEWVQTVCSKAFTSLAVEVDSRFQENEEDIRKIRHAQEDDKEDRKLLWDEIRKLKEVNQALTEKIDSVNSHIDKKVEQVFSGHLWLRRLMHVRLA